VPDRSVDFLLIGGGVAAARCAETLRSEGSDGSVLVVGREADAPYERPPLSKEYLTGRADSAAFVLPPDWWSDHDVELLTRVSAMKLDLDARVAKLSSREEVGFDKALIATGAMVRRLRVDGSGLDGIHYLRSLGNADAIRADAVEAGRVALVGGSYIACELAFSLTSLGVSCTILMQEDAVLERHFGAEVGRWVQAQLEERGVELHGGDELAGFGGPEDGRVERVVSAGGVAIDCGCAVLGTGVTPDVMLARAAGLSLGERGGVACTSRLETSCPGVFAAGDVAEFESAAHGRPALVEHWEAAAAQGRTAALNMLGRDVAHEEVPYFWSDLGDWATLEYVGVGSGSGDPVLRGSLDDGDFTAVYQDGDRIVGVLTCGSRAEDLDAGRRLVASRAEVARDALADAATDLASLSG
jgi:3-phenylpropionate/trans-cinnamate dioxygenase ferredoxin reductase subunit